MGFGSAYHNESSNKQKKSLKESHTALWMFLFLTAVILLFLGLYIVIGNIMQDSITDTVMTPEEKEAQLAAEKMFFPQLDVLYEKGDYDGLVSVTKTDEAKKVDLLNYDHYDLIFFYGKFMDVRDKYIPELDKGTMSGQDARLLTQIVFEFYYRCYDNTMDVAGKSTPDDITYLDGIREDYMKDILYKRMRYTEEDMEAAKDDIMEYGYFHIEEAFAVSDRYSERYR